MNTQPEALRLADELELCWGDSRIDEAAAELRRLHEENELVHVMNRRQEERIEALLLANQELLEALKDTTEALAHVQNKLGIKVNAPTLDKSLAAIAKHGGAR